LNSPWFSIVTVVAALVIGYVVLSNRDTAAPDGAREQSVVLGYYLKDAIITETSESGAPHVRFAASEVTQDTNDNSVTLAAVRADYVWPAKDSGANHDERALNNSTQRSANHWVLNADQARVPAEEKQSADRIELRGNVEAHSVNAAHDASLRTQSLDIDTDKQLASSAEAVRVDIDGHTATGRGLRVDMDKNRVQLVSEVTMRRAPNPRDTAPLSLPEAFESDSFEYSDNILILTKVRSKSEPFISADQARATGIDLSNNQWVLRGAVRMELPKRGLVTADLATVTVRNNRVVHAQLTGAPVNFQHTRSDSGQIIHGRANTIEYDVLTQILQFSGEPWFSDGKFELKSDFIEYNLTTEAAHGTRGSGGPVAHKNDAPSPETKD